MCQSEAAEKAERKAAERHHRAFGDYPHKQIARRRADGETDSELARAPADRECQHARHTYHSNKQGYSGENARDNGIEPFW